MRVMGKLITPVDSTGKNYIGSIGLKIFSIKN